MTKKEFVVKISNLYEIGYKIVDLNEIGDPKDFIDFLIIGNGKMHFIGFKLTQDKLNLQKESNKIFVEVTTTNGKPYTWFLSLDEKNLEWYLNTISQTVKIPYN